MSSRFAKTLFRLFAVGMLGLSIGQAIAEPTTQPATAPATTGPATTTASPITWDQAAKHVGETLTITGPVKGTHVTSAGNSLVLNIGKDYPDPSRFSVMIKIDDKHPASADTYEGKNITVTGKIELYKKVPEVKVNPADVTVAE